MLMIAPYLCRITSVL